MLDLFLLLSIGFFTLLPAFFFFGLFLMIIGMGVYYGLSQIKLCQTCIFSQK